MTIIRGGRANLAGALWMTAAMAGFAVEDVFLKSAARTVPLGQVLTLFGLAGLVAFIVLTRAQGAPILTRRYLSRGILIRSCFEAVGRLFYSLAFVLIPLTTASAIVQASPLVVMAGAALFLGEKVGWRRWLAVAAGFCGVMLILRPGLDGFDSLALLAVAGMIGFAGRDLATRAAPPQMSNMQLGIIGFAILTLAGAGLWLWQGEAAALAPHVLLQIACATGAGVFAYFALTAAMRIGDIGAVTPWRYTRLLFALILGAAIFGERPDTPTLIGSAIVVGSGIFALIRGHRQAASR